MTSATAARRGDLFDPRCPTRQLLDRIGTKWTSMAIKVLAEVAPGEVRFAELRRRMPGISQKMLSVTLRSLVHDGLVTRRVEPTVPPGVHYALTDLGLSLEGPLSALRTWAEAHMAEIERNNRRADDTFRGAERSGGYMGKMHADEAEIDADLVRRLLRAQFPQWADLPVTRLASGGTVNAIYRLGEDLTVRLPLQPGGAGAIAMEARLLPRLAPLLPLPIPEVVATGAPGEGYPLAWAVHRWIEGRNPVEGDLAEPELVARDLAEFAVAIRKVDLPGGPSAHRGRPLITEDQEVRAAIEALRRTDEPFDADEITAAWEEALEAPLWTGPACWTHSDLMPSNLLLSDDRLSAIIDFGTVGMGEPATDLIPAWNLLPARARRVYREAVDVDDATWARSRGWALSMAVIQLPYYRTTNPIISANARYVIREILGSSA